MSSRGRTTKTVLDVTNWPAVLDTSPRFAKLQKAIGRLVGGADYSSAATIAGVTESRLRLIVKRCQSKHKDGKLVGWRACQKGARIKDVVRTAAAALAPDARSLAGAFSLYMNLHPEIVAALKSYAARKGAYGRTATLGQVRDAYSEFIELAKKQPGALGAYPLNTKQKGRRAFAIWWKRHIAGTRAGLAFEVGDAAAQRVQASTAEPGIPRDEFDYDPLAEWEIDETEIRIDAVYRVQSLPPFSVEIPLPFFQVLKCKDCGSGAVLAQSILFSRSVRLDDLLHLYFLALTGAPKIALSIENLHYAEGADYPANAIPEGRGVPPKRIRLDNSLAHLSNPFRRALASHGVTVDYGPSATPEVRGSIEAEMAEQALRFARYLPHMRDETGSKTRASSRHIDAPAVEEALDVFVRNRNAKAHRAAGYATPLARIREALRLGRIDLTARLTEAQLDPIYVSVGSSSRVLEDIERGRAPFVWFLDIRYKSSWLRTRADLVDKKVEVRGRIDLRRAVVFLDGKENWRSRG
jgi:putative transposase